VNPVVVVPCYNEAKRIVLPAFEVFGQAGLQVLFVDDGSRDDTRALLSHFVAGHPFARLLPLDVNGGKAEAVRQGLLAAIGAGASVVGYFDADLATPPDEMVDIMKRVQGPVQAVLGSRVALLGRRIERTPGRHYLGRVFATAASWALGLRVYDTQCGAKAFAVGPALRSAMESPFTARWAFDVELLGRLLSPPVGIEPISAQGVLEVPLKAWRDVAGSKLKASAMAKAGLDVFNMGLKRRA
jgi:dolichyl-phosphate beta-glucosyltransferase